MTVYIDDLNWPMPNGGKSCHLTAIPDQVTIDGGFPSWREELHDFAFSIGMRRSWYQERAGSYGHYDAMGIMIEKALKAGAIPVEAKELLKMMKERDIVRNPI